MASVFNFYTDLFTNLNSSLTTYVSDVAADIIGAITPVATTLLAIYVTLWGWTMMRGMISEPITDGVARIVRLTVVCSIALNLGYYNAALSDWLWNSPDALAAHVASGYSAEATNVSFLDALMAKMYDLGDVYWQAANASAGMVPVPDLGLTAIALLIWLCGILTTGYGAFLLALSKMALAILLGVGPIFVLLTMFEPTKRFFDAWIGQAANYILLVMLTAAAIKLILTIINTYLGVAIPTVTAELVPSLPAALPAIGFSSIAILVMIQLPSMASALGGGVAVSTLGAVGWAYGKARGGLSAMRPTNLRRSYNKAASDLRIVKSTAKTVGGTPLAVYRKITGANRNRVAQG